MSDPLVRQTPDSRWEITQGGPGLCGWRETADAPVRRTELPGLRVPLIFDFGELRLLEGATPVHHRGGFVAGLGDGPSVTEHDGVSWGVQLELSPLVARRVLGLPMDELANRVVPFDDLVGRAHRGLCDRLRETPGWDARFALVEAFVAHRLAATDAVPPLVAWAWTRIARSGGAIDIGGLAKEAGFSRKHLVAQFRAHVGLPPKRIARLVRFDAVIRHLAAGGREEWGELAQRFGFSDQSHLNREFRTLAGATPTETRAAVARIGTSFG